jgi:hypothetical protein
MFESKSVSVFAPLAKRRFHVDAEDANKANIDRGQLCAV